MVTIYDEEFFVNYLYAHSELRMKLLGIQGRLPALSNIAVKSRISFDNLPLVGRDEEKKDQKHKRRSHDIWSTREW